MSRGKRQREYFVHAISIQTGGVNIPETGTCDISLRFDWYFIPKEQGSIPTRLS
jgi:hypothetical protein